MPINDDRRETLRDGAVLAYRLLQWFRAGRPDRDAIEPPVMRGPTTLWTVVAAVAVIGVGLLVFFGVIAVGLKVFEYGVEPIVGVSAVALGFVCLWQLPKLMAALPTPEARVDLEGPLLIVGLIISACLLVCGFQVMGNCEWVRNQQGGDNNE